ncbi:hypothetical protein KIN20_032052 [Parelaphostrongylus tenuis]|uniref:Uncharacterized protein n=1 Tax=Parelaphostrongylus tenuis TaxID=148309 RepID=A0AAD5R620_PARTN|nr:hypothetical protein KIN20_032052 [Parelaphostrongylus tenuis]
MSEVKMACPSNLGTVTGPINWNLLPAGKTVNAKRLGEHLYRCDRVLSRQRGCNLLLLQDNAKQHVAKLSEKEADRTGRGLLNHPSYSFDLSSSVCHLCRSLEVLPEQEEVPRHQNKCVED